MVDESKHKDSTATSEAEAACEAIMEATYRALCKHGTTDLTVQAIANEFNKSRTLIFYHYDSKEHLLSSFLAHLLDRFKERVAETDFEEPDEQLDNLVDALLFGSDDNGFAEMVSSLQCSVLERTFTSTLETSLDK